MQSRQRNQQFQGNSVKGTLAAYELVWTSSTVLTAAASQHTANLDNIKYWQFKQEEIHALKGLSKNKNLLRAFIINDLVRFIGAIKGYGAATSQWNLVELVNYPESELAGMSATNFITAAQTVHQAAVVNVSSLLPYSITPPMVLTLGTDINNFDLIYSKGKELRADSKTATTNLAVACKEMMSHLKVTMDNLVKQYIGTPFYTAYFNSRKIYNLNKETTALRGHITDSSNGAVIKTGLLELVLTGVREPLAISKKGEYHRSRLDLTNCTLSIRVPNYLPAEFDINLKKGNTTIFDIQMVPAPVVPANSQLNSTPTVAAQ